MSKLKRKRRHERVEPYRVLWKDFSFISMWGRCPQTWQSQSSGHVMRLLRRKNVLRHMQETLSINLVV
jgi:hypothetical protein